MSADRAAQATVGPSVCAGRSVGDLAAQPPLQLEGGEVVAGSREVRHTRLALLEVALIVAAVAAAVIFYLAATARGRSGTELAGSLFASGLVLLVAALIAVFLVVIVPLIGAGFDDR